MSNVTVRKATAGVACAAALFAAAACQSSDKALVARAEARAKQQQKQAELLADYRRREVTLETDAKALTPEQAASLEERLARNPGDLRTRKLVLAYYMFYATGREGLTESQFQSADPAIRQRAMAELQANNAAVRRNVLWMIGNDPQDELASPPYAFALTAPAFRAGPPELENAKSLWLAHADRDGQPAAVYLHAAAFFAGVDLRVSEKLYLRAQAADPEGDCFGPKAPGDLTWPEVFGGFYAQAFTVYGSGPAAASYVAFTVPDRDKVNYLTSVRRKLELSPDASMLLWAGDRLVSMRLPNDASNHPGFDAFDIGKAAVQHALQLDPNSTWAHEVMNKVHDQELWVSLPDAISSGPLESRREAIEALPEGARFRELAILAVAAGDEAVQGRASWQPAAQYAREALEVAPKAVNHPDYGKAFFNANMVLGMAALKAGEPKVAERYLMQAADAPATDDLRYPRPDLRPWVTNWSFPRLLTAALLKAGERGAVAEFLDRYANLCVSDRERSLEDAAVIRTGKTPGWAGL